MPPLELQYGSAKINFRGFDSDGEYHVSGENTQGQPFDIWLNYDQVRLALLRLEEDYKEQTQRMIENKS